MIDGNRQSLADAISSRVNCRNIGKWLADLESELDLPSGVLTPEPPLRRHEVVIPGRGLRMVLSHPHAGDTDSGDPDRWIITELQFLLAGQLDTDWSRPLPFGLSAQHETPLSAAQKLDGEVTGLEARAVALGDFRQSFLINDALVVDSSVRLKRYTLAESPELERNSAR